MLNEKSVPALSIYDLPRLSVLCSQYKELAEWKAHFILKTLEFLKTILEPFGNPLIHRSIICVLHNIERTSIMYDAFLKLECMVIVYVFKSRKCACKPFLTGVLVFINIHFIIESITPISFFHLFKSN